MKLPPLLLNEQKALTLAIGLGLAFRFVLLLVYLSGHNWKGETWEYEDIANNLLAGKGYTYSYHGTVYRSLAVPLFPVLSYFLHVVGGPELWLFYAFHLLTAAMIVVMTYFITDPALGRETATLAAILMACDPASIIYQSYKVDPTPLATLFLLAGLYIIMIALQSGEYWPIVLAGVAASLGILTRPDAAVLLAILPLAIVLERSRPSVLLTQFSMLLLVVAVLTSPWVFRNYIIHRQFLLTTGSGEYLWRGNNPRSTGTGLTLDMQAQFQAAPAEFQAKIRGAGELDQNQMFQAEALGFIRREPAEFLWRSARKFYYFWWFTPTHGKQYYEWLPPVLGQSYKLEHLLILVFSAVGFAGMTLQGSARQMRFALYILGVVVANAALHSVFYVEGRHRVLIMPLLLIFAAFGICRAMRHFSVFLDRRVVGSAV